MSEHGDIVLEASGISKSFPGVKALDDVSITLRSGRLTALLGENGAGKSTLMNILSGLYQPDSGRIFVRGQEVHFRSPRDAIGMGIGMIHQNFMLIQSHTVLDNVILGTHLPMFLNRRKLAKVWHGLGTLIGAFTGFWKRRGASIKRYARSTITPFILIGLVIVSFTVSMRLTLLFLFLFWVSLVYHALRYFKRRSEAKAESTENAESNEDTEGQDT